ncbi:MAG: hypothetical protein [Caudoviricetes sp.]|nr:MAG: hypothetical protein [Caudoviricetes sp.]
MAGFLGNKAAVTSAKVDTSKGVERGGGNMPDGTRANLMIERMDYRDASESEFQKQKHGLSACQNAINGMFRIKETQDGKYLKKCVFHSFFMASDDSARAAKDQQIMAMCAALAVEQDANLEGLHEEIFGGEEWPAQEVLSDTIGTMCGVEIGVFTDKATGKVTEFIRKIGKPYVFEQVAAGAGGTSPSGRKRRSRS